MADFLIEISIIVLLIILNGLLAMAEIAIISSRKSRLQQLANEGNKQAQSVLDLATSPGDFLSTIQIGITLVGVLAGAFGGATIAESLAPSLAGLPVIGPYSGAVSVIVVVLAITFLTIVVGELVPKRIALNKADSIAMVMVAPMRMLSLLALPLVLLLRVSTDAILWALHIKPTEEPPVTEEEIQVLIDQGAEAGVFEEAERDMVESVFRLDTRRVNSLMVPRNDVIAFYTDDTIEEVNRKISESGHSSYPVVEETLDNVLGVVFTKDLLTRSLAGQKYDLKTTMKEPLFIPEGMTALKALEMFKKSGKHIAVVVDEYGGMEGLITVHDILEAVVGDVSEIDKPKIVQREDGSWLVDGMLSVDEFKSEFDIEDLPQEESGTFQTVGGFVMMYMHRIPVVGDKFIAGGYSYEVVDMDGLRVDKILLTRVPPADRTNGKAEE